LFLIFDRKMVPDIAACSGPRPVHFATGITRQARIAINSGYVTASGNSLCDKFLRIARTKELMEVIKTLRKDTSREDQFR
jgi:hypothetical protein